MDNDYNVRRIERFLSVAWDSGAMPVIVLNKADLCDDPDSVLAEIAEVAMGVDAVMVSATTGRNMDTLMKWVEPGKTVGLLGSSGVGKSTIINFLLGEQRQETQGVRTGDQRGRHTTTSRELVFLPNGACLLDTPGMRSFQPWSNEGGLSRTFEEIEAIAEHCKFADCTHTSEPGCAVLEALENGEIDDGRWQNYRKMLREQAYLERRQDQRLQQLERDKWKAIAKRIRNMPDKRK
jgi:ribosome biogenesis GTPase